MSRIVWSPETGWVDGPPARVVLDDDGLLVAVPQTRPYEVTIGILNAHMFGAATEPGERVDWSTPDIDTSAGWAETLGEPVEEYAAKNPHMIVFEVPL